MHVFQAREAGVQLIFLDAPNVLMERFSGRYLKADKNKFNQVIRNLVSNALKFTPRDGTVSIDLQLIRRSTQKSRRLSRASIADEQTVSDFDVLLMKVKDTGAGISQVSTQV